MAIEGGCYCGEIRYVSDNPAQGQLQCHCRECQYISGGSPNVTMGMPEASFAYTQGSPKAFQRSDLDAPVTREFCPECGTHLLSRVPGMPAVLLKVGTLDSPGDFGTPQMAIFLCDNQPFHVVPEGVATFDKGPGS